MALSLLRALSICAPLGGLFIAAFATSAAATENIYTLQIDPSSSFVTVAETPAAPPSAVPPGSPETTVRGIRGTFTVSTRDPDLFYFHNVIFAVDSISTDPFPSPPGRFELPDTWRGLWQGTRIEFDAYPCAHWWGPGSCLVAQPSSAFAYAVGSFDGHHLLIDGTLGSDLLSPYSVNYHLEALTVASVPEPEIASLLALGVIVVGSRIASRRHAVAA